MRKLLSNYWVAHLGETLIILVIAALVVRFFHGVLTRIERSEARRGLPQRRATVYRLLASIVRYVVDFVAIVMILSGFHIQTASIVASAGILGLAVSFGAQGLVQDVVTGMFLLYEDQFSVGEQITFPNLTLSGTVREVGIRITRLTGTGGELVIIPNRLILEVQNHSRGTTSVAVQVPVSPAEDPKRVQESLQRAVTLAADQGVAAATVTGVTAFASAQITWTVSAPATAANLSATDRTLRQAIAEALYQDSITLAGMVQKGSSHG